MKRFDRSYYDHWYRNRETRVVTPAEQRRRAAMVVGITEHLLDRPLRSVLDVGCGEGTWRQLIRRLRPRADWIGIDPSEYVVDRFGRSRGIRLGTFGELGNLGLEGPFDLVVCSDVIHFLKPRELDRGLPVLVDLLGGIAFLDVAAREDQPEGDLTDWRSRPASWYVTRFMAAGLTHVGLQCWIRDEESERLSALERV